MKVVLHQAIPFCNTDCAAAMAHKNFSRRTFALEWNVRRYSSWSARNGTDQAHQAETYFASTTGALGPKFVKAFNNGFSSQRNVEKMQGNIRKLWMSTSDYTRSHVTLTSPPLELPGKNTTMTVIQTLWSIQVPRKKTNINQQRWHLFGDVRSGQTFLNPNEGSLAWGPARGVRLGARTRVSAWAPSMSAFCKELPQKWATFSDRSDSRQQMTSANLTGILKTQQRDMRVFLRLFTSNK